MKYYISALESRKPFCYVRGYVLKFSGGDTNLLFGISRCQLKILQPSPTTLKNQSQSRRGQVLGAGYVVKSSFRGVSGEPSRPPAPPSPAHPAAKPITAGWVENFWERQKVKVCHFSENDNSTQAEMSRAQQDVWRSDWEREVGGKKTNVGTS